MPTLRAAALYESQPPDAYAAEHAALLRTAPQPTLYLHGDRDGCIDVALVADAQTHLAQNSRLEVIEGVGHFLHVQRPRAVNERILAWILSQTHQPAGSRAPPSVLVAPAACIRRPSGVWIAAPAGCWRPLGRF